MQVAESNNLQHCWCCKLLDSATCIPKQVVGFRLTYLYYVDLLIRIKLVRMLTIFLLMQEAGNVGSFFFSFLWPVAIAVQRTAFTYLGRAHERRSASKCMAGTQLVDPPRPCT